MFRKKIKQYFYSVFFVLTFLFVCPLVVKADHPFDPASGDGSSTSSPYLISTCEQLQSINSSSSYYDSFFELKNDIDCSMTNPSDPDFNESGPWSDREGFDPIANFTKVFDGKGYRINGLYVYKLNQYATLFSNVAASAEIKNIKFGNPSDASTKVYMNGGLGAAAVANNVSAGAKIENISVYADIVSSAGNAAGLIITHGGSLIDLSFTGTINSSSTGHCVGGLIANFSGSSSVNYQIVNSHVNANISSSAGYVGGLAAYFYGSVASSSFTGTISSSGGYVGGLIANNNNTTGVSQISNSHVNANISSSGGHVGGLSGFYFGSVSNSSFTGEITSSAGDYVGGLIAYSQVGDNTISNSFVVADISAAGGYVGGLGGSYRGSVASSSFSGDIVSLNGSYVGGLIAQNPDTSGNYQIVNSHVNANISSSGGYVGGLGGYYFGSVSNSNFTGEITSSAGDYVGGLIAYSQLGGNTISNSHVNANISSSAGYVGGLGGSYRGSVASSSFSGNIVSSNGSYVGGLLGEGGTSHSTVYVSESFSKGTIRANGIIGGLIGYTGTVINSYSLADITIDGNNSLAAGLIGSLQGGSAVNSYFAGTITNEGSNNGIYGISDNTTSSDIKAYWDTQKSGIVIGVDPAGKSQGEVYGTSTENMQKKNTYSGFSMASIIDHENETWYIDEGYDYPRLSWEEKEYRVYHTVVYTAGEGGSISGSSTQSVVEGKNSLPVEAVPDNGYNFVKWSDNVLDNPRTDTNINENFSVSAVFEPKIYYIVNYEFSDGGSISGSSTQSVEKGKNASVVEAVPDNEYYFVKWSDNVLDNSRTDTNINENFSVSAIFALKQKNVYIKSTWNSESVLSENLTWGINCFSNISDAMPVLAEEGNIYLLNSVDGNTPDFTIMETLNIERPLNIIGENLGSDDKVLININSSVSRLFEINSSNVSISNLKIRGTSGSQEAIHVITSASSGSNITVSNNEINNASGVIIASSSENLSNISITNNKIRINKGEGVSFSHTSNNYSDILIKNNEIIVGGNSSAKGLCLNDYFNKVVIENNKIYSANTSNSEFNIFDSVELYLRIGSNLSPSFNFSKNWWGSESGPDIYLSYSESQEESIFNGDANNVNNIVIEVGGVWDESPSSVLNINFRPFYTDYEMTTLSDRKISVSEENNLSSLFIGGTMNISPVDIKGEDSTKAKKIKVAEKLDIEIPAASDVASTTISLPANTEITKADTAEDEYFTYQDLSAAKLATNALSGFQSGELIGALQWGIPNIGLSFSSPVTIEMYVGTDLAGQTLDLYRSTKTDGDWTKAGLSGVDGSSDGTCLVSATGMCKFKTTKASYFGALTIPPVDNGGGSGGSSGGGGSALISQPSGVGSGSRDVSGDNMALTLFAGEIDSKGVNFLTYVTNQNHFISQDSSNKGGKTNHYFTINSLDLNTETANITFFSDPKTISIKKGETKELDLDGDKVNDISVTFSNVYVNRAEITVKQLSNVATVSPEANTESTVEIIKISNDSMYNKLKGKIILKVEDSGRAYYISPIKKEMYYLGRPTDAFSVMRSQGIGITNANLDKILVNKGKASSKIDSKFTKAHLGKIFIQTELNGEAWYVNPSDSSRHFLGRPNDAFQIMRNLSLGISNVDFAKLMK